ncbi:Ubiquinol-cytochrome C chaperone [Teratosphaeria destructans]|uniref:Ubiquinol-cytochrome C chaperone n=1 Tax=Teratosphaeria destructans TaxID=418781 RepID=A0A9W7W4C6_9PEZI|nr:Ubiquinol-cytochrome C chaperone [Teratosphaeria destructans]
MSTLSVCASCLRTLRHQVRRDLQHKPQRPFFRQFSTAPSRRAKQEDSRFGIPSPPAPSTFSTENLAKNLRANSALRSTTEPYIAYGGTEDLFKSCTAHCSYTVPSARRNPPEPAPKNEAGEDVGLGNGFWFEAKEKGGVGLSVTFGSWSQVVMMYMYLLTVRLRTFPKEHVRIWEQNLVDHFFYAAEDRMAVDHLMTARGVRNKYLKDLWLQWRGLLLSYDEGLIKGDAVLAAAVWRNMFQARHEVDLGDLALVVAYMRQQLQFLERISDDVLARGHIQFWGLEEARRVVGAKESPWMAKKFVVEDLAALTEITGKTARREGWFEVAGCRAVQYCTGRTS